MTEDPDPEDVYQDGRIASFDHAIECKLCDRWVKSPKQFDTHMRSKGHRRAAIAMQWNNLIIKIRSEIKSRIVFEQVAGSMTECLKIDPWRRILKRILRDRVLREAMATLRELFQLAQTNRLLVEEAKRRSKEAYAQHLRERGRTIQRMWPSALVGSPDAEINRWHRANRRVTFQQGGSTSSGSQYQ